MLSELGTLDKKQTHGNAVGFRPRLWQNRYSMSFPFGRPILVMMICSLAAGGVMLFRQPTVKKEMTLWVSVDSHARMYQQLAGKSIRVDLIAPAALDVRLLSLFMFGQSTSASPDLAEVDLGSVGKFFRPPLGEVGLVRLNDFLQQSGWMNRIMQSRFAPWSKEGAIFGVPDDLHPCTITYRKDLFDQAGVDLASAVTWIDFQQKCLAFQKYWNDHGHPRMAMGLSSTAPDMLMVMLHPQHLQLVDADLSVHLIDAKVARTLWWYAQAVAGPRQFATDLNSAPGQNARDLAAGEICSLITPDWMIADLKQFGPELNGQLRMMPLPRFALEDARTASWGGTMIGITKSCRDPQAAWKIIESLYLDHSALKARQKSTGILPPIPAYWSDAVYHQPDPFYGNQKIDELYIQLARELPETKMTAYTTAAQTYLAIALNRAVGRERLSGDVDLDFYCKQWLDDAQTHVESMIRFDGRR